MDVRFVNAFVGSIVNVFKTMVHADVEVGKPVLKQNGSPSAEVSGIIGLTGDVQGCVVLSFPGSVAEQAASKFAGADLTTQHPDFTDAIGELANMVAGNARKGFVGYNTKISLPSVVVGGNRAEPESKASPFIIIPCETEFGRFNVEIALATVSSPAGSAVRATAGADA